MQTRILPAVRGAAWIANGFRLYRRNPPLLTFLTLAYLTLALLISQIQFLGVLLPLLLPTLVAFIANVCRTVDQVSPVSAAEGIQAFRLSLMRGLREQRRSLLRLGVLQLFGTLAIVLLDQVLPGVDTDALFVNKDGVLSPAEGVSPIDLLLPVLRLFAIALPLVLAFWFAPLLTAWDSVPPAKSLFFSLVAVWRNWRAFIMYGLTAIFVGAVLPGLLLLVANLFSAKLAEIFSVALSMFLLLVFAPVLMTGAYLSYGDVFEHAPVPGSEPDPAQGVDEHE
jgi:hypothetical protein